MWLSPTLSCTIAVFAICLYLLSKAMLPTPLPGIPCDKKAANRIFGDVPEMISYVFRTRRIFCWLTSLTTRHSSPIVQVFIKPGAHPWVILTDPFESQICYNGVPKNSTEAASSKNSSVAFCLNNTSNSYPQMRDSKLVAA
ncbi:hypothetical protein HBI24_032160 [Parastagonospora nodorum]|nr:hypothetical protein HBH71_224510 [Parastagonospora nodorum]KAH5331325.1 hypothetical protein HBI50_053600 [Parastagonospora nodorum]KAH5590990.1 hypothetical protein HBI24_032160 [Parastagonospora nodorum]KAH5678978.1 hypothetical protein HBI44_206630 [Parastagonospora nodorum]KAH6009493.1 hypothetical protein HBI84_051310 [Parastagonospora nodorum]